ncbi:MAG: TIGR00730 family Rossman fold protein [Clostridia bacterium]|nr:TIGR00730 family Rossman fold protein [Clostridia bacterium]
MRICVYGSASPTIDNEFIKATEIMGEALALRGHNLVFGGGGNGLMCAAARGFKKGGAHIIGVIPDFFRNENVEAICDFCDKLIEPKTMRERKAIMEDHADAFIVTPGGIGTYEEFFEILTSKQLCRHNKPIAIYNIGGFYNEINAAMHSAINKNFIKENCTELYFITENLEELIKYIETPVTTVRTIKELKDG